MADGQTNYKRPNWDEYFLEIMEAIAKRGTCERGRAGCVIAKDNQILAAGYVGSPIGEEHCDQIGHLFQDRINKDGTISKHCVRTVHAEQNAICQAARRGIPIEGSTLYCRMTPCPVCAKMIINCGIKRVICLKLYHDGKEAERLFSRAGVALIQKSDEEDDYANKRGGEDKKEESEPSASEFNVLDEIIAGEQKDLTPISEDIKELKILNEAAEEEDGSQSRW
jgi:dCMP deaminase